jgi:hypothetical protein
MHPSPEQRRDILGFAASLYDVNPDMVYTDILQAVEDYIDGDIYRLGVRYVAAVQYAYDLAEQGYDEETAAHIADRRYF